MYRGWECRVIVGGSEFGRRWKSFQDGGNGCITMWMYLMPWIVHLKIVKVVNFMLCVFYHNKKFFCLMYLLGEFKEDGGHMVSSALNSIRPSLEQSEQMYGTHSV